MSWRTEGPYFFLATSDDWRSQLAVVVATEIAIRGLAREESLTFLLLIEITDCALVAIRVVSGESLRAGGLWTEAAEGSIGTHTDSLQSSIIGAYAIEEVGVAAKSVAVLADHVLQFLLILVIVLPFIVVVI